MKILIYYFSLFLFPISTFAELEAIAQHVTSPADGDAININIEALKIRLSLYEKKDIQDFETGKLVKITIPEGSGTKSEATKSEPGQGVGFKFIAAEILIDPKTKNGTVAIEKGPKQKVKLNWLAKIQSRRER
jgi:hypothetical protein